MPFMTVIAKRPIFASLAEAKYIGLVGSNKFDWFEHRTLVRIVAEGLVFRKSTRAVGILFPHLQLNSRSQ